MKTSPIHLTLALLTTAVATAQEPEGQQERRPPPVPPFIAIFDADHNGTLDATEIQNAAEALGKLDKNDDGEITREEMRPPGQGDGPQQPPKGKFKVPPVVAALDADKNGKVSAEELAGAPESLKKLDKNNDGELSLPELCGPGPQPPRRNGNDEEGQRPPNDGGQRPPNDGGQRPQGPPPEDLGPPTE